MLGIAGGLMLLVGGLLCAGQQKDGDPVSIGVTRIISSKAFGEDKVIYISLPLSYRSGRSFPVFYALDGLGNFSRTESALDLLGQDKLPEMIVVGLTTRNRQQEYTLAPLAGADRAAGEERTGGLDERERGVQKTLRFIIDEVAPFIEQNYRTTRYRFLFGGSLSASYVLYAMLSMPEAFDVYIASSPNIGQFGDYLIDRAAAFFGAAASRGATLNKRLYISYSRKEHWRTVKTIPRFVAAIEANRPRGFDLIVRAYDEPRHNPFYIPLWALTALYPDWTPAPRPEIYPRHARLVPGRPVRVEIDPGAEEVYYTLDGSEPSLRSARYAGPIEVMAPLVVKARIIRGELETGPVATCEVVEGAPLAGEPKSGAFEPGLRYRLFRGYIGDIPDTIEMEPSETGVVPAVSARETYPETSYLLEYSGYVVIETPGYYLFSFLSGHPSRLVVGPQRLNNIFFGYFENNEPSLSLYLEKGMHPIRLCTTDFANDDDTFVLSYRGPGMKRQPVPAGALFHKDQPGRRP
jgi:predicted alpha/beta superfamily hydrolase